MRRLLLGLALVAALTTGCDDGVEATPQAFAHIAASHLGEPETAKAVELPFFVNWEGDFVGADLRTGIGADSEADPGDSVYVLAGTDYTGDSITSCEDREEPYPYCAPLEGGGALTWSLDDPEEDPGSVVVAVRKGDTTVAVVFSGPHITRDPRTMDLPVTIDQLAEVARDDRLDLTTTQEAVDAGARLDYWVD